MLAAKHTDRMILHKEATDLAPSVWSHTYTISHPDRDLGSGLSCASQILVQTFFHQTGTALSANIPVQRPRVKRWASLTLPQQPVQRLVMWQGVNTDQADCTSLLPLQKLFALTQWAKDKAYWYLFPSDITALNIEYLPQTHNESYKDYRM